MSVLLILYNTILLLSYVPALIYGTVTRSKHGKHFFQRYGFALPKSVGAQPSVWLHAASVGEVRSLSNVVTFIRSACPNYNIVISTFTETGYAIAKDELKPDVQFILPLENIPAFIRIIKNYNIKMMIITDTEIWLNLIYTVSKFVPMILLNGRISNKTFKNYKKLSFIFSPVLQRFTHIFAKSDDDAKRFLDITNNKATVASAGNLKYNLNKRIPLQPAVAQAFSGRIALAASTHSPEEEIFFDCALGFKDKFDKIILAPRHINRTEEIRTLAEKKGFTVGLYSEEDFDKDVVIVDAMGLLESLYQVADRIFVGGSIANIGGHNIFEALQYSKQVAIGTNMYNFQDITDLAVSADVATIIHDKSELLCYFTAEEKVANFDKFFADLMEQQQHSVKIESYIKSLLTDSAVN